MKPIDKLISAIKEAKKYGWSEHSIVEKILEQEKYEDKHRTINQLCEDLI